MHPIFDVRHPYDPMSTVRNVLAAVDTTTNFGKSAKIKYVKMSSNRFDSEAINDIRAEWANETTLIQIPLSA